MCVWVCSFVCVPVSCGACGACGRVARVVVWTPNAKAILRSHGNEARVLGSTEENTEIAPNARRACTRLRDRIVSTYLYFADNCFNTNVDSLETVARKNLQDLFFYIEN